MTFSRIPSFSVPSLPLRAFALGVLLSGAPGCQPDTGGEEDGETAAEGQPLRVANSLTTQALVFNAITTNPTASVQLTSGGLQNMFLPTGGTFAYLQRQLADPGAQQVMSYLVSCALDATSTVSWKEPSTGLVRSWKGQLGLCPEWKTGAPSEACKNRVSACLLARNNALGRHVELSLRGEDVLRPALFSLEPVTPPGETEPVTDAPVPSFTPCPGASTLTTRDCGWKPDGIGRCVPGQTVRLGAGAPAPDQCDTGPVWGSASGSPMMLRVCEGVAGCDDASPRRFALGAASCGTSNPSVNFTCPASGFFNVLKQATNSTQSGTVAVQEETGTLAATQYPLSEAEVYTVREGAYYGNIFDPDAIAVKVYVDDRGVIQGKDQQVKGSVYRRMYSCQAVGWSDAAAYAAHRLCALPSSNANCAAIATGLCVNPSLPAYPSSRCATPDGALVVGDQDYEKCHDTTGTAWGEPITVFLHGACDVAPGACKREDVRTK